MRSFVPPFDGGATHLYVGGWGDECLVAGNVAAEWGELQQNVGIARFAHRIVGIGLIISGIAIRSVRPSMHASVEHARLFQSFFCCAV